MVELNFAEPGVIIELKFMDGVSQTLFSLGILNDEALAGRQRKIRGEFEDALGCGIICITNLYLSGIRRK